MPLIKASVSSEKRISSKTNEDFSICSVFYKLLPKLNDLMCIIQIGHKNRMLER